MIDANNVWQMLAIFHPELIEETVCLLNEASKDEEPAIRCYAIEDHIDKMWGDLREQVEERE